MSRTESAVHSIHTNSVAAAGKRGKGSAGKRADIKAKITALRDEAKLARNDAKEARADKKTTSADVKEARAVLRSKETAHRRSEATLARIQKRQDVIKGKISRLKG